MIRRSKPIARSQAPIKRSPLKLRARRAKPTDDPQYLAWLRTQPCILCRYRYPGDGPDLSIQTTATEAAHVGVRGLRQKCPDEFCVPLCSAHHRTGKQAQHVLGRRFWEFHKLDRDVEIRRLRELYERER